MGGGRNTTQPITACEDTDEDQQADSYPGATARRKEDAERDGDRPARVSINKVDDMECSLCRICCLGQTCLPEVLSALGPQTGDAEPTKPASPVPRSPGDSCARRSLRSAALTPHLFQPSCPSEARMSGIDPRSDRSLFRQPTLLHLFVH